MGGATLGLSPEYQSTTDSAICRISVRGACRAEKRGTIDNATLGRGYASDVTQPDKGRRARISADPALVHDATDIAHDVGRALETAADDRGLTGADRGAWIAAMCVLLEGGLLTDVVARRAAMTAEYHTIRDGRYAQDAHRHLATMLGVSLQGLEARLRLVGDTARGDTPGAATLRAAVFAELDREQPPT